MVSVAKFSNVVWLKGTGTRLTKSTVMNSWTNPVTLQFFFHLSLSMFCSWSSREQADLGWSWMCVGRGCGSVCTVVPPWPSAQSKNWNTRQYPSTVCWPQTPAPGDAQDLVIYQWQHHLEDSHKCSQKSKCWSRSASWWTGEKILPGEENWSGQRYVCMPLTPSLARVLLNETSISITSGRLREWTHIKHDPQTLEIVTNMFCLYVTS